MRLLWLADVLRDAGLTVHEYPGWETRGRSDWGPVRGVICHATAGSRSSTDEGETRTLWVTGSTSAPVPISQLYLSRSGDWWVGASGRCNHVLVGDKGPHKGFGNSALIGVEAQNDNMREPWSSHMLDSYQRGVAAILRTLGLPALRAAAHREHQSGKSDPLGIDMTAFRAEVARLIEDPRRGQEEDDMLGLKRGDSGPRVRALQAMLSYAGHPVEGGVDGQYGPATAAALKALRRADGSAADVSGDAVDEWALRQIHGRLASVRAEAAAGEAVRQAKAAAEKAVADALAALPDAPASVTIDLSGIPDSITAPVRPAADES